jgi:hypothetical protein
MRSNKLVSIAVLGTLSAGAAPTIWAQEELPVPLGHVPPIVRIAAIHASQGADLKKAAVDYDETGVSVYELSGENPQGQQVEVDVTIEGKVVEIEKTIGTGEVPPPVLAALNQRLPGFQLETVELSLRHQPLEKAYEFEGKNAQGVELDVEISEDGRRVLIQEDIAG